MFSSDFPAHIWFQPRPDRPADYDQQTSFVEEKLKGVAFLVGGNGAGTTSCSMHKIVRFLMDTPPPRFDTPFWIIGESYDQICETAWKEKLNGQQFLPPEEVDWARITWLDSKADHPKTVPLLPWEGRPGKNWMIEFKSYKQGRAEMQGRSIGGFCFVEQFPWSILKEVHRGCREYNFPGSMMAEFTPIDPVLSLKLQEMQENGTLPSDWNVYRANTRCAMEAGHVDRDWYNGFFGSMDSAERSVREIGAWATFESQIYPKFNPLIHNITSDEVWCYEGGFPLNAHHYRAIDWGFSAEHAFACVYGFRRGDANEWVIYDEYVSNDQKMTVDQHLFHISNRWEWPYDAHHHCTYADPSRPDCIRIATRLSEYKDSQGRSAPSMSMAAASNAVFPGIDHIRSLLAINPDNGKPKLRICKERCPTLWRQMQTYRWKRGSDTGLNPRAGAMEPVKMDDDAVDALRYLLYSEAKGRGATISQIARSSSAARSVPGAGATVISGV